MREEFSAPTPPLAIPQRLQRSYPEFRSLDLDVRAAEGVGGSFAGHGPAFRWWVHTAAQPSHDWAASAPAINFGVKHARSARGEPDRVPEASFSSTSSHKVCGDTPNRLPRIEPETRRELPGSIATSAA
jgi:CDP-paratose 2-epimerase